MGDFTDLLQEANKISIDIEDPSDSNGLPKVERSIRQVLEASKDLYTKVSSQGATQDVQASLLLGSKGIDLPKIVKKLESISNKHKIECLYESDDTPLADVLDTEIRRCIYSQLDVQFSRTMRKIRNDNCVDMFGDWQNEKRKIFNSLVNVAPAFESMRQDSMLIEEPHTTLSAGMPEAESRYAQKVIEYNRAICRGTSKPNLLDEFTEVANQFRNARVKEMWNIMRYMSNIPTLPQTEDVLKARTSNVVELTLVQQACAYLEDRYKTYMSSIVNENLEAAKLGGTPGTYPLVRSFVGLRLTGDYCGLKDDKIDGGRPLWPMVYYCMRSGDASAAMMCLRKRTCADVRSNELFQDVMVLLEAWQQKRASKDTTINSSVVNKSTQGQCAKAEQSLLYTYKRHIRNESDPFKRIVCALLAGCDANDEHAEVAQTADDYLWLKLNLVRPEKSTDSSASDHVNYHDLQRKILEDYGETYYDAYEQPHVYFQMLALSGQFEAALDFLMKIERYKVHAVHMAIYLNELYLLAVNKDITAPLLSTSPLDDKATRRLNIVRMLMIYVKAFEGSCLNETLNYFCFLRKYLDDDGVSVYQICVQNLAIESRKYQLLFGEVRQDGLRNNGLVDQFTSITQVNGAQMAEMVGRTLLNKGLKEEAIMVFDIANNETQVLSLLNVLISTVVHLPLHECGQKERLLQLADELSNRYSRIGYTSSTNLVVEFRKLRQLADFFDFYHNKRLSLALAKLQELELIPFQASEIDAKVKAFGNAGPDLLRTVPDVLLATMNILFAEYQKLKGQEYIPSRFQDSTIDKQLSSLRNQAKVLVNFTGLLQCRMPADINSKLVQMEILMH